MILTFVRRPQGAGEVTADVVRVATAVSVVVGAIGWGGVAFAVMMLGMLGVLVPRALGVRPAFDVLATVVVLVACWSSVLHWYTTVPLWDKLVHLVLGGVIAGVLYLIAERSGVVPIADGAPRPVVVLLTLSFGLAIGAVWEMAEWAGHTFVDATIFVGYVDTIGDLATDGLGALVMGCTLPFLSRARRTVSATEGHGRPRTLG